MKKIIKYWALRKSARSSCNVDTNPAYKQNIQEYTRQITDLVRRKATAWINAIDRYEQYVQGKISKEEFRAVQDIAHQAKEVLIQITKDKDAYEK